MTKRIELSNWLRPRWSGLRAFAYALLVLETVRWAYTKVLDGLLKSSGKWSALDDLLSFLPSVGYLAWFAFGLLLSYPLALFFDWLAKKSEFCAIDLTPILSQKSTSQEHNLAEFYLTVRPRKRIKNAKIYCQIFEMQSDWTDQKVNWVEKSQPKLIFEGDLLHGTEVKRVKIAQRGGSLTSPLEILGINLERNNLTWPYCRVDVELLSDEGKKKKSFAILSPGYPYNSVRDLQDVPLTKDAFVT